jgi:cell division protein FtsI (penicillin-binding protein 3)
MRSFGFGDRSGIELPSETRGLLRPTKKWGSTSILSLAIGQEVGVTPIQLVTMVSAIANGGTYLPPHILLQSTDDLKGSPRLQPATFHPQTELPSKLPDGAHRVIQELTAAKMRSIMEGIVVEGTGKNAALNGYSSAGKTGTAEKIDPATHTYSHTKLVASFAGFAPVNNPAISVAVVIDTPTVGTGYGSETSAPVFAEVAQEVLEYLGVPHDQPLKTTKQMLAAAKPTPDDAPSDNAADLAAMFDQINDLPADDPLRSGAAATAGGMGVVPSASTVASLGSVPKVADAPKQPQSLSKKLLAAFASNRMINSAFGDGDTGVAKPIHTPMVAPEVQKGADGSVVVDASQRVSVPVFTGQALRNVVETAAGLGLRVDPVGSGTAREQAPAPGTMVPLGTQIVVRFSR